MKSGGHLLQEPLRLIPTDNTHSFDDSAGYERFVGTWGRAAGAIFLDWLAPPAGARWLDVGCGTGLFTELIVDSRSPAMVFAIDPGGGTNRARSPQAACPARQLPGRQCAGLAVSRRHVRRRCFRPGDKLHS
jgi:SAM-dependent methyltransferase